jgi:ankyrin repeat protein
MDLIEAVRDKDLERVKLVIQKGTDVNYKDDCEWTALFWSVYVDRIDICKLLLENGADVNKPEESKWTPLIYAVATRKIDIIKLLLIYGANVHHININGQTALCLSLSMPNIRYILRWRGAKYINNEHTNLDGLILIIYSGIIPIDILREIHCKY